MGNDDKLDVIIARIDRMEDKVDKVNDTLNATLVEVAKNTLDLSYHIARTNALEKIVELEKKRISTYEVDINHKITELEKYPAYVSTTIRLFAAISTVLGLFVIIQKLL